MGYEKNMDTSSINLPVLNVGNGWVAGGCWDDLLGILHGSFPKIPCVARTAPVMVNGASTGQSSKSMTVDFPAGTAQVPSTGNVGLT